jgi:hypothetical protein
MLSHRRPVAVVLVTAFFGFGMVMASLAAIMLLFPGTILDALWRLNPKARDAFAVIGFWAGPLMLVVAAACATAASGLWRCERWGYIAAVSILSINLVGDTLNVVVLHDWRTIIGLPIGGTMIAYLVSKRQLFRTKP